LLPRISLNANKFIELFISWIKKIVNQNGIYLSIDSKAIKSARDKINGGNTSRTLYWLSYLIWEYLLVKDDKSNEIIAILDLIDIKEKML